MNFENIGHILVFGQTGAGKTKYTKKLIKQLNPENVYVFTTVPDQWEEFQTFETFDEVVTELINQCNIKTKKRKAEFKKRGEEYDNLCPNIIVFDDFNFNVNTRTNEMYNKLITSGRHAGIRIIITAHNAHNIGPTVRDNCRYVAIMSRIKGDSVVRLANYFYDRQHSKLHTALLAAYQNNPYNCVVIDTNNPELFVVDNAENESNSGIDVDNSINEEYVSDERTYIKKSNELLKNRGTAMPISINNGPSIHNTNIDQSVNTLNLTNQIKLGHKYEMNRIENKMKIENVKVEQKIKLMKDIEMCKDLIYSPFKSIEDEKRIVETLNKSLKPNPPFTLSDYEEGIPIFMKKFHNINYVPSKKNKLISDGLSLASSGFNPMSVLATGMKYFETFKL